MNQALLTKLAFHILANPNSLLPKPLAAKYEKVNDGSSTKCITPPQTSLNLDLLSYPHGRSVLDLWRWQYHPFMSWPPCSLAKPNIPQTWRSKSHLSVLEAQAQDREVTSLSWNRNKIKTIFPPDDIAAILKLPAPAPGGRGDTLLWNKFWTRNLTMKVVASSLLKNQILASNSESLEILVETYNWIEALFSWVETI